MQKTNRFDPAQDDQNVQQPERCEAHRRTVAEMPPAWNQRDKHRVDSFATDPSLNAKPAARDECSQNRRNVCTQHAKRSTRKHRKRNSVLRAGMRVEQHGDQHQHVAQENGEQRLFPVHPAGNHAAGEHVGRDVHAHGDPQRRIVVRPPGAALERNGSEILVVERALANSVRG